MHRARYSVKLPAVVAGVPIPESRNPCIAAPVGDVVVDVEIWECESPRLDSRGAPALSENLESVWRSLAENLGFRVCGRVALAEELSEKLPQGGLYASLTSILYYALAEAHGETPSPRDIVEVLSLADAVPDESFRVCVDALRYSASSGYMVAYRDVSEVYEFKTAKLGASVEVEARVSRDAPRLHRDAVGLDLYSSLIHTAGLAVLLIAEEIRDGVRPLDAILKYKPVVDAVAIAVWGLDKPPESCVWSPSLPGVFELLCFRR